MVDPARVHDRAGGAHRGSQGITQALDEVEVLGSLEPSAAGHDDAGLRELDLALGHGVAAPSPGPAPTSPPYAPSPRAVRESSGAAEAKTLARSVAICGSPSQRTLA